MSLFQVDGWDLKERVIVGGVSEKSKAKKEKKRARNEERKALKTKRNEEEKEAASQAQEEYAEAQELEKEQPKKEEPVSKKRKVEDIPPIRVTSKLTPLQQKMMAKLSGSRFRWINEQLYTITSNDALELIKQQPALFDEYHQGFRSQVEGWPENPVDVFVNQIKLRGTTKQVNAPGGLPGLPTKKVVIADMGCGEAQLALDVNKMVAEYNLGNKKKLSKANAGNKRNGGPRSLDIKVHSFDLKKQNDRITVADIKNVPLPDQSCTIVIFCLALMGTNFLDFIKEANRLLVPNGELWIAEIKSRFTESTGGKVVKPEDLGTEFVNAVKMNGFFHKNTDNDNKMFTRFEFFKPSRGIMQERNEKLERRKKFIESKTEREEFNEKRNTKPEGEWLLKPCIYKRR